MNIIVKAERSLWIWNTKTITLAPYWNWVEMADDFKPNH